jgi:hypothetical protein
MASAYERSYSEADQRSGHSERQPRYREEQSFGPNVVAIVRMVKETNSDSPLDPPANLDHDWYQQAPETQHSPRCATND